MSQSTEVLIKLPEMELTLNLPNGIIRREMCLNEWEVLTFTSGKDILTFIEGNEHILMNAMGDDHYHYIRSMVRIDVHYYADWTMESMQCASPLDESRLVISCFS